MRVWITEIGEPLPLDDGARLLRCGLLTSELLSQGHSVVWWSSSFDHARKAYRRVDSDTIELGPNYRIRLLPGVSYTKNASVSRVRHHRLVAREFALRAPLEPPPDLVYSCLPTLELSEAAVRYAGARGVPAVVDVRDLWPDIYLRAVPPILRGIARVLLNSEFRRVRRVLTGATAIVAVSEGYLEWALSYAGRPRRFLDTVYPHGYPHHDIGEKDGEQPSAELARLGVEAGKTICLFVGSFGRTYDLAPVIAAARRLQWEGDDRVQFVFAGDGERAATWRSLASDLMNVVFTGWLGAPALRALLELADVGLAAYGREAPQSLPNKLFEYLAAGLPVLSSLQGEAELLLMRSRCGITYTAGDAESFATALSELLKSEPERRAMGRRGFQAFEAEYAAERVYPRLADHLGRVARDNTR